MELLVLSGEACPSHTAVKTHSVATEPGEQNKLAMGSDNVFNILALDDGGIQGVSVALRAEFMR